MRKRPTPHTAQDNATTRANARPTDQCVIVTQRCAVHHCGPRRSRIPRRSRGVARRCSARLDAHAALTRRSRGARRGRGAHEALTRRSPGARPTLALRSPSARPTLALRSPSAPPALAQRSPGAHQPPAFTIASSHAASSVGYVAQDVSGPRPVTAVTYGLPSFILLTRKARQPNCTSITVPRGLFIV